MITLDSLDLSSITPEKLGEMLVEAKKVYYTSGRPIMDDHTYDTLENILRQKLPHHRIFQKVGHKNFDTGWSKKKHTHPMSSQNKVNTYADLVHYFELKKIPTNTTYVVQPKCDGISLEIEYNQGVVTDAITRGDGKIGDVITQNVVKMKNFVNQAFLPSKEPFTGSVRCEIVVTKSDFDKLNKLSTEQYSNPRNAASGLSQRLDSQYSEYCSLYAVDIVAPVASEKAKIDLLKTLGFVPVESWTCTQFDQIEEIYQKFLSADRDTYPFEIDGLVIKINDVNLAQSLGSLNNRPKYQVAYKFPASSNLTTVNEIVWQVGPLGNITPVAQVEPIELSGAIITFASLANYNLIEKMNLNVGDIVEISRRGDVIPHIEKVITKTSNGHLTPPTICPSCHTKLIKEEKFLKCPNTELCPPQILGCLRLFCDTLEILGLSDKTIAKLYQAGRVRLPGDFFLLTVNDIQDLDKLGEKSAQNIIHQINQKRTLTLTQIFDSAIIPHFSQKRISQLIHAGFDTPEKLLNLSLQDFLSIKGYKQTLAEKIIAGISLRKEWIKSIISQVKISSSSTSSKGPLEGLTFCITGTLSSPRKDLETIITANGGTLQSSVTKNTNYLLTNDTNSNSSKFLSAKKLGTKIISEAEFSKLLS
jgi:DNA ligase (NAD+)